MKIITTTLLLLIQICLTNAQSLEDAIRFSHKGQYEQAENIFENIIPSEENQTSYYLSRAYNYSWWGKYDLAEQYFKNLLTIDSKNEDALLGLAYNTSWKGERDKAVHIYKRVISINNQNRSAWFGLAYNYLEKDNLLATVTTLDKIESIFPEDEEYFLLLGLLAIKQSNRRKAVKSFRKALTINPDLPLAKEKLEQFESIPAKWAISAWHGSSESGGDYQHSFRRLDVVYNPNSKYLFYGGYDNSLILQNSFLRVQEKNAPYLFLGGKYSISERFFVKGELGNRRFANSPDQWVGTLESTYFVHHKLIINSFLLYDHRNTEALITYGAGVDVGITNQFRTAFSYFRNQNLTYQNTISNRFLVNPKILLGKTELNLGYFYDLNQFGPQEVSNNQGYFALFSFPIVRQLDGKLFYHLDDLSGLFSIGLTFKL